jgi:hypothetical protein
MTATITYSVTIGAVTFDQDSTDYQLPNEPVVIGRRRRRITVVAPHVPGALELASVADEAVLTMTIRCYGGGSNPQTLVDAITAAVDEDSYDVTVAWDGATRTWAARAADWACPIGGADQQLAHRRDLTLTIPVAPYPT